VSTNVYLVGMPGSGKTRVGYVLARLVGLSFVDLDREIEASAGSSVAEIFEREGEGGFRRMESEALEVISAQEGLVVSCGGGVVLDAGNRALLSSSGKVVWLSMSVERLRERAPVAGRRPLLQEPGDLERLMVEREPFYGEVADVIVDSSRPAAEVARTIARSLEEGAT
jgi:shikimate kinase